VFVPTRQPIVIDLWEFFRRGPADTFTTVGNWRQSWRPVTLNGEVYRWSKHLEFLNDPAARAATTCERALLNSLGGGCQVLAANMLDRRADSLRCRPMSTCREFIGQSKGEFTVAKDQNVRLRSDWFSDRSARYLACGRPVVTQETGFSNILPTGEGLFAFSTFEEIEEALHRIDQDYARPARPPLRIAREFRLSRRPDCDADRLDCKPTGRRRECRDDDSCPARPLPDDLVLAPVSRWPTTLSDETVHAGWPSAPWTASDRSRKRRNVRMSVSRSRCTTGSSLRICLSPARHPLGCDLRSDRRRQRIHRRHRRPPRSDRGARRQGARAPPTPPTRALPSPPTPPYRARGGIVVFLTTTPSCRTARWTASRGISPILRSACSALRDQPRGQRSRNRHVCYRTYGELQRFARDRAASHAGHRFDIRTATMFCAAVRRMWDVVGPLDENPSRPL
jgi:hypothetical protein